MAFLQRANGTAAGQIIELKQDRTLIGRSPEHCHVVLDPNGVSRRHAEIYRKGDDYFLADLNSRNLTKVNNGKLIPGTDHRLTPGDRINICDVEFLFYHKLPTGNGLKDNGEIVIVADGESADVAHLHTLDASRSSAMASMVKPEVKLKAILEITRNLSTELKIDKVAPRILDSLMELFPQAERLFLILVDPETKRLVRKAFRCRPGRRAHFSSTIPADEAQVSISRSIVNHVLVQKKAVLSQDAGMDKNLPTSASIADLKIRSVMCVPLLTPDSQALGILQLDTSDRKQFHQEDLDVLTAVASQAAIAIQNATLHESLLERERVARDLKLAEQVQKRFLPQSVPEIPGFEFFAHYDPAYEVGGDYYDFVPLPGDRCAIAVGDVSGKGVAAALDDGQVFRRHALLHPHRKLARCGRYRAQSPALLRRHRREVHHPEPERPRCRQAQPVAELGRASAHHDPAGRRQGRGGRRGNRRLPAGHRAWDGLQASRGQPEHRGRRRGLFRRRDRCPEPARGTLRLPREPAPAPPGGRDRGRAGNRGTRHPPGYPRIFHRP